MNPFSSFEPPPAPNKLSTTENTRTKETFTDGKTLRCFLGLNELTQLTRVVGGKDRFSYTFPPQVRGERHRRDVRNYKQCNNYKEVFF